MAFTATGFDGSINEAQWSQLFEAVGLVSAREGVISGLVASVGAGTRAVALSAGDIFAAGVRATSPGETVNMAANGGSTNRLDYVVALFNWTANTVTTAAVDGGTTLPALTRTAGTTWQVPLAAITVRPGVTTIAAADIRIVKPLAREPRLSQSIPAVTTINRGGSKVIDSLTFSDPGWPWKVRVTAQVRFNPSSGFGILNAIVNGVTIGSSYTPILTGAGGHMVHLEWATNSAQSGNLTVQLEATNSQMNTGDQLEMNSAPVHVFTVEQKPA